MNELFAAYKASDHLRGNWVDSRRTIDYSGIL